MVRREVILWKRSFVLNVGALDILPLQRALIAISAGENIKGFRAAIKIG
jgi:hypothetical protein